MLYLAFALLQAPDASSIFLKCAEAHKNLSSVSAIIHSLSVVSGQPLKSDYKLECIRGKAVIYRVKQLNSEKVYGIGPSLSYCWDVFANEWVQFDFSASLPMETRIQRCIGNVELCIEGLLNPKSMGAFLAPYATVGDWNVKNQSGTIRLSHKDSKSSAEFAIDSKTNLLLGATLIAGGTNVSWSSTYGKPPKSLAIAKPKNARHVAGFLGIRPNPEYADVKSKKLADRATDSYKRLTAVQYSVSGTSRASKVWFSAGKAREDAASWEWSYQGGRLNVFLKKSGRLFSGDATPEQISALLLSAAVNADPVLLRMVQGHNPMQALLISKAPARRIGEITLDSIKSEILMISGPGVKVTTWIRKDTGLLSRVIVDNFDQGGNKIASSETVYGYARPISMLPSSAFTMKSVPTGIKSEPISALKPH